MCFLIWKVHSQQLSSNMYSKEPNRFQYTYAAHQQGVETLHMCDMRVSEEGLFHGHFPGIIQSKGSSLPLALRLNKRLPGSSLLLRFDLPGARHASVHRLQPMERMAIEARPIGNRDQQRHRHSREVHVHHRAIRRCEVAGEESH